MHTPRPRPGRPRWLHLPRRTARLRLTVLYGAAVFLACGAVVVAVTYLVYGLLGGPTPSPVLHQHFSGLSSRSAANGSRTHSRSGRRASDAGVEQ